LLFDNRDWNGIDFLEVSDDQRSLCVHFFGPIPDGIGVDNVVIGGGRRIRSIGVVSVRVDRSNDPELDDCMNITVDRPGDFSTYRLCLVQPAPDQGPLRGLDPRYSCLDFTFKVGCPSDLDCGAVATCPPAVLPGPEINYLAKDYASFRQLLLDRLAVTMPEWGERHIPDIGVTVVELLAYVGDYLSYYQDAVATEAYLDTARLRISVRRHARLVDYFMHEGCNARAWVCVATKTDLDGFAANDFYFITSFPGVVAASGRVVKASDLEAVPAGLYQVFEALAVDGGGRYQFWASHSHIPLYTWGDKECCLAVGATGATLLDEAPPGESPAAPRARNLHLQVGDVVVFEEVLGPTTGNPADADPLHRHAVRLTGVAESVDGLAGRMVLEIEWSPADALPFALCLSSRLGPPSCSRVEDVSVARGNVVLVEHGRRVGEDRGPVAVRETVGACACDGSAVDVTEVPERFRPVLGQAPVSFAEALKPGAAASGALTQVPRRALPEIALVEYRPTDTDTATGAAWEPVFDLLGSGSEDRHFVAEIDDDGQAHLRFGDGDLGRQPDAGVRFQVRYRVGNGPAGNTGRDTINYLVTRVGTLSADAVEPRNPLPAVGGLAPEPVAEVKLLAPSAFRSRRERAITAADYAQLAGRDPRLQRASADLRWTGTWYEARVAVDPADTERPPEGLLESLEHQLERYRRMGHDLEVVGARYVPIALTVDVCLLPHAPRGAVLAGLLGILGNGPLPDGRLGFFHPDNLSFGDGIRVSKVVAAALGVDGVETLKVTKLQRLDGPDVAAPAAGILSLGPAEIAQLDNDADFPENGVLIVNLIGGR
jgi:hypothetical protein